MKILQGIVLINHYKSTNLQKSHKINTIFYLMCMGVDGTWRIYQFTQSKSELLAADALGLICIQHLLTDPLVKVYLPLTLQCAALKRSE